MGFTLSLNVAVLTMTHYIPYELATKLIVSESSVSSAALGEVEQLAAAIAGSYRVQSLVMLLAAAFSISRTARSGVRQAGPSARAALSSAE